MVLLTEPRCDVALTALQPRVDQDVIVEASAMLHGTVRPWDLQQP